MLCRLLDITPLELNEAGLHCVALPVVLGGLGLSRLASALALSYYASWAATLQPLRARLSCYAPGTLEALDPRTAPGLPTPS